MIKVSQLQYKRIEKDEILSKLAEFEKRFQSAESVEEFMKIHAEFKEYYNHARTMTELAGIRFTLDTRDEFYQGEQDYYDEIGPEIGVAFSKVALCYLNSKFRNELEKVFPRALFVNLQMQVDANNPLIVEENVEQNKLVTEYVRLISGLTVEFRGEKLPLSKLSKYNVSSDRETRKLAYRTLGKALDENGKEFDRIYDQLVAVRTKMGRKIGYDNFSPLGYLQMQRNCYGKEDIAKFRANVKKYIVPLASKIRERVAKNLNLGKQYIYDSAVFTAVEPAPTGSYEEIFDKASKMYNEMSPETGKLFDTMRQSEAFDCIAREGKSGGGYCTELSEYRLPFIFSNFNGSADDIGTLTHEFGHAFEAYKSFDIDSSFLSSYAMETAEVHSMSMEFLTYPWMKNFFEDKIDEYKFYHLSEAVCFIPYGTIVDYFQQHCYDNPDLTPKQRCEFYKQIEAEFLPHIDNGGIVGLADGRRWQRQSHIFEAPFYYIDYCLAQFTALQFLALSQKDYDGAFEKYLKFVSFGGTKTFVEILAECGLKSPFEEQSFVDVVEAVEKILKL